MHDSHLSTEFVNSKINKEYTEANYKTLVISHLQVPVTAHA